jgi:hypothetical protein
MESHQGGDPLKKLRLVKAYVLNGLISQVEPFIFKISNKGLKLHILWFLTNNIETLQI